MKTAIITAYGGTDKIAYIDAEQPIPKKNQLLIKVNAFALNPKDILVRKGKFKNLSGKKFPQKIGFEFSGVVETTAKSSRFQKGDNVFGMFNGWQGQCSAEYICIEENLLTLTPSNISQIDASGISLAGLTALQALRDIAKVQPNCKVFINGASGGVGTLAIQVAKSFSAHVMASTSSRNIELCQSLGADIIVDYTSGDILKKLQTADVFFDVYGNYSFKKVKRYLNKRGRYITTVPSIEIFKEKLFNFFRNKKAHLVIVKSKQYDLDWLAKSIENNELSAVTDKVFSFDKINQAQQYIETKRARGKVNISMCYW